MPILTTHTQERIDTVLPQAAIRFARTLLTILGVRDALLHIPVMEMPPPLTFTSSTSPLPVIQTPVRSLTPNNRSLSFLQTGPGEDVQLHIPQPRGAVSSISIASTDLLLHVEPLPMLYYLYMVVAVSFFLRTCLSLG